MRVLLVGGAGYIGSHTAVALAEAGHEPLIVDDLSNSDASVLDRIARASGIRPSALWCDARDTARVSAFIDTHGPIDVVIHLAGLKAVAESVQHPVRYYDVNLMTTIALLKLVEQHSIPSMVFSSSATVYGSSQTMPLKEDAPTGVGITNPYGRTKHMIEEMLRDVCAAAPRFSCIALRYFNPVGAHPSGLLGERPHGMPNNLMPVVARVARGQDPAVTIFGDDFPTPDGTGLRDYIHVQDLARGHVRAAERATAGFDVINLGTGVPHSVRDVIRAYGDASGVAIPVEVAGRRPGDVAVSYADVEKAARVLDWRAELGLADACRDDWRWQLNADGARRDD